MADQPNPETADPAALIAQAREALKGVTSGPWHWSRDVETEFLQTSLEPGVLILDPDSQGPHGDAIDRANARFIAASRTLVPALADALEAAQAEAARKAEERRAKRYEDLFCDLASEGAEAGLLALMTGISEQHWAASWMHGLEFSLWRAMEGGPRGYGMSEISERQIRLLRLLSEEADGWWRWDDGPDEPRFVRLEDWREIARAALYPAPPQEETP